MAKHMRVRKKSFKRRMLAWLGISHTSKQYFLIYFLALAILILLFPLIMKTINGLKKYYGKGYGYVPRDFERVEKLTKEGRAIPLQPGQEIQHEKAPVDDKKKSILDPYR
ncbi:MAG: hypothetical protein K8F52_17450 [Candidatus Scalindua rubra]|uniref:Uncharacterized protein n=1 Tax=Candidatus Scalindua brodae TaxID=237368 RepID=A0A0B0EIS0_9BACT|nr:MAG: hypothetical protein SCABRO_01331 [Candidatus Scalindua brodae]MBZ0110440.1 hypothetical protein [Candidatus Scalindua rubra]TWU36274.1 hypothetical protein S225a_05530 [Candidatus Brocadiaceae bacterium S225]